MNKKAARKLDSFATKLVILSVLTLTCAMPT